MKLPQISYVAALMLLGSLPFGTAGAEKANPWNGTWTGAWGGTAATKVIVQDGKVSLYEYQGVAQPSATTGIIQMSGKALSFGKPPGFIISMKMVGPNKVQAHYHGPGGEADADLVKQYNRSG